jgi:hypothetical protein
MPNTHFYHKKITGTYPTLFTFPAVSILDEPSFTQTNIVDRSIRYNRKRMPGKRLTEPGTTVPALLSRNDQGMSSLCG